MRKEIERQFFDYVNRRDIENMNKWLKKWVADDFVNHSPLFDVAPTREGLLDMLLQMFQHFPDTQIIIKDIAEDGDILCFRHSIEGMGVKPFMGLVMIKYTDEKITDRWAFSENPT